MGKPAAFTRVDPDLRRSDLVEAAARVLARDGVAGASVRVIAVEAGVSPGLVTHHFGGIDALIAATYAHVGERVDRALAAAVAAAGPDPRARLDAYVAASFAPPIADPALLATWVAFWGMVKTQPAIADLHDRIYGGYRAGLETLLAGNGLAAPDLRLSAIALTALVDGLWLELCLSPGSFTPEEASAVARRQVDTLLLRTPAAPAAATAAR